MNKKIIIFSCFVFMMSGQVSAPIFDFVTNLFSRKQLSVADRSLEVRGASSTLLDKIATTFSVDDPIPDRGSLNHLILAPENTIKTLSSYLRCQNSCTVLSDSTGSRFNLDVLQAVGVAAHPIKKKWANPMGYGKGKELARGGSVYLMKGSSKFPGYLVFNDHAKGFFFGNYVNRGSVEIWVKGGAEVYIENLEAKTIIVHATGNAKLKINNGIAQKLYVRADGGTTVNLAGVRAGHVIINPARGLSDQITICPLTKYSQLGGTTADLRSVTLATDSALTAPTIIGLKKYKAKRFVTNTIPQYFKRTINATLLTGGLVVAGTAVLTFVSSLVMGFELAVGSTEYFDKVQDAFSSGSAAAPGDVMTSNGDIIHPDGTITHPEGTVLQSNGDLLRTSNGDLIHPDGSISHLNGSTTELDGTIEYPSGTVLQANGDLLRASNGDLIHPDGSVTHANGTRVYLNGDIGHSNGDIFHTDRTVTHPDGTITRVNGDIYNPTTKDVAHLNGSVSHEDGRVTLSNGDISQVNGDILHRDGSVTYPNGVTDFVNGDRRLADGTRICSNGDIVRPSGSIRHPDGTITHPAGTELKANGDLLRASNGDLIHPNGSVTHVDGSITELDGDVFRRDGTILRADGTVTLVNGDVRYPNGNVLHPNDSITLVNGDIRYPSGDVVHPDGTITYSDGRTR